MKRKYANIVILAVIAVLGFGFASCGGEADEPGGDDWLARKLSCDRSNVYRLFQKRSIETDLLIRISVILNRDFAIEISKAIQEKYQSQYSQQK